MNTEDTLCRLLSEARIPYRRAGEHHHVRQGWLGLECPWCGKGSQAFHLGISASLRAKCWRCGRKSIAEVWKILGLPEGVWRQLRKAPLPSYGEAVVRKELQLPPDVGDLAAPHQRYLRSRGLDPDALAELWGLRGIGRRGGSWAWRLFAPVAYAGETLSWVTRRIGSRGKRWMSAPAEMEALPVNTLVYGLEHVTNVAFICEGAPDCWSIGHGAVACLNLGQLSYTQLELLSRVPVRVVVFDDEPIAQKQAGRLASQLSGLPGETYRVELRNGCSAVDPGEAMYEEIEQLREEFMGPQQDLHWLL